MQCFLLESLPIARCSVEDAGQRTTQLRSSGTSLLGLWLTRLFPVQGVGSIPGWGVKIPCTSQPKITKQNMEPMLNKFNRDLKILKKKNPQNPKKRSLAQRLLLNSKISFVCRSFVILHILSFLLNQMMNC